MPEFPVSPGKTKSLAARMAALGIREGDLVEKFVRSRGKGGQNVNRVATCVILSHKISGLTVRSESSRTQGMNRYFARKILADKLDEKIHGDESAKKKEIEKLRRQKRKRSKRAKEKMLETKREHSKVKELRRSPQED